MDSHAPHPTRQERRNEGGRYVPAISERTRRPVTHSYPHVDSSGFLPEQCHRTAQVETSVLAIEQEHQHTSHWLPSQGSSRFAGNGKFGLPSGSPGRHALFRISGTRAAIQIFASNEPRILVDISSSSPAENPFGSVGDRRPGKSVPYSGKIPLPTASSTSTER